MTASLQSATVVEGQPDWAELPPHPALARFVSTFWTVALPGPRNTVRSLPDACVDVVVSCATMPGAFLSGPQPRARTWIVEGPLQLIAARLAPGAAALWGVDVGALPPRWTPLDTFLPRNEVNALVRAVRRAPRTVQKLGALEAFVSARFLNRQEDPRLSAAIARVFSAQGLVSVEAVANTAGVTPRTLGRLFDRALGMSPKRFARIARFQAALRAWDEAKGSLADLAVTLGYSDQAHFNREVKELFGTTPTHARLEQRPRAPGRVSPSGAACQVVVERRGHVSLNDRIIKGTGVSSGIAQGTAYVLACTRQSAAPRRSVEPHQVEDELVRFEGAVVRAERELLVLKAEVAVRIGPSEAEIFAAQALVVRDHSFAAQVADLVRTRLINAEAAVAEVIERFTHSFDRIADAYLRERAADIRDVGRRVLAGLIEQAGPELFDIPPGSILVTDELLPSTTARLELGSVIGFVTERGGKFSHTSILARSLRTPAVAGAADAPNRIKTGDRLIVDGVSGLVFLNPDAVLEREYAQLAADLRGNREELEHLVGLPAVTRDGTVVPLLANVSKFADTEPAFLFRADGIGLYRTELGYSIRDAFPTEDEQVEFLKRAAERFHPRKVVLRLLDIGGDKELRYFPLPSSRNPSLAQRGIRVLLKNPEILKRQLKAFLRISADHPISILMPVVGGLEEVRQTRQILSEAMAELKALGVAYNPQVALGAMIEIPAAAMMVGALAKEVDFFSLGTNDLVQYVLAADREDETVADYYQPLHPGVLRLIHFVAQAAHAAGRELTICGEMAGDPAYTELLLGLGLRSFSVGPGELLEVKQAIRAASIAEARQLADEALGFGSVAEIEALVHRRRRATGPARSPDLDLDSTRAEAVAAVPPTQTRAGSTRRE